MTPNEIKLAIIINLAVGTFFFILGLLWPKIRYINKPIVRWFFGKGIFRDNFFIVHGSIVDNRIPGARPDQPRFRKSFHDGRVIEISGPWGNVVGDSEIRSSSYLINAIDFYRSQPIRVLDDLKAFTDLNASFISLGSSSSNEISDFAIRDNANKFLQFGQDNQGVFIRDRNNNQIFRGFEYRENKDIGVILKVPNTRSPGHYFFVCAGLGDWGTSGASWYLANQWKKLPWSRKGFGIIVEVDATSDTSAKEIYRVK